MPGRIAAEIKQTKPFSSAAEEAALNIVRTADSLLRAGEQLLQRHGLTGTQYNVLRILRGAGAAGLTCGEIAGRMINAEPDITRLLDRMEKRGLVRRRRDTGDRRCVTTRITPAGLDLLAPLDRPVDSMHRESFAALSESDLNRLIALLEKLRASWPGR